MIVMIDMIDRERCLSIFDAMSSNDVPLFKKLVKDGGGDVFCEQFEPLLLYILDWEEIDFMKLLLEEGVDYYVTDLVGNNALHKSSLRGDIEFVKLLIQYQRNLDVKGSDGLTALNYAAAWKHWDVVEALLEAGADPDISDDFGGTARSRILSFAKKAEGISGCM